VITGARAIPLADVPLLRTFTRRTNLLRFVGGAAVIASALTTFVLAERQPGRPPALLPSGSDGVVVLDLSASISSDTYARIGATLDRLARSNGRYGLVLFSDTAYEALPPGMPARELRPFERYFRIGGGRVPGLLPTLPTSPWADVFSAGTRISAGLQKALELIQDERLQKPAVLLVSDLDDDTGDIESLASVALAFRRLAIPIRVVGLNPSSEDERLIARLLPHGSTVGRARLPGEAGASPGAPFPVRLVIAAIAATLLLAAYELLTVGLRWRRSA
jgi:hypothetical protein